MRATLDHRVRGGLVTLEMPLAEFREHVEWLEELAPRDGATADFRAQLDRIDPSSSDRGACERHFPKPADGCPACGEA